MASRDALPVTAICARAGAAVRIFAWARRQRELSARVHAAGDEHARRRGWTVPGTTRQFGVGARTCRHRRFDDRRRQYPPAGSLGGQPRVRPCDIVKDHLATAAGGTGDD